MQYIAYYRVSTVKQGYTGLGMEAQKQAVEAFCKNGNLLKSYADVESGKIDTRPELMKAIQECKATGARLIIAKLDRLSRNMAFLANLMEAKISFTACDMPEADEFTIHIFAALAQKERKLISERTRAALAAKKRTGWQPGSPQNLTYKAVEKSVQTRKQQAYYNEHNRKAGALIIALRTNGQSWTAITKHLNELGFYTRKGKAFHLVQVQRLYNRYITGNNDNTVINSTTT